MTLPRPSTFSEDPLTGLPWPAPFTYDQALHDVLTRLQDATTPAHEPTPGDAS